MSDLLANLSFNKGSTVRPGEDVAQEREREKDGAAKKNDKNRAGGRRKKMAGEQQRDYWRDMTRRGDVRYTVS